MSSRPCEFDITLLALLCQSFEEEENQGCNKSGGANEDGTSDSSLVRRRQDAKAAHDDAYKDDFSSDESEQEENREGKDNDVKEEEEELRVTSARLDTMSKASNMILQKQQKTIGLLEAADIVFENSICDNFQM